MNKESVTLAARDFHARFPVSVKLRPAAEVGSFVGLQLTPKRPTEECRLTPKTFPSGDRSGLTSVPLSTTNKNTCKLAWKTSTSYATSSPVLVPAQKMRQAPPYFLREKPRD